MPSLGETVAALARKRSVMTSAVSASRRLRRIDDVGVNRGNLRMLTYTPDRLAPGAGLVVVLHGCTQTAEAYAEGAGWLDLADQYGFAVLCPEQARSNNPNLCFNWFQHEDSKRGQGEPASIYEMIVHAVADHDLDPKRVFISGLSAGGAMANVMLATYPEVFAAGAIIAGLPYGAASNVMEAFGVMNGTVRHTPQSAASRVRDASAHQGSWPRVSVWQGDQDTTVKPEVAEAVVAQWVGVHQAKAANTPAGSPGRHRLQTWVSRTGETVVELHRISRMGHGTPLKAAGDDAWGAAGPFLLDVGISSSSELVRSWGLAGARREAPAQARRPPSVSPAPKVQAAKPASIDVGEVIAKALRTAGLMK